MILTKSQISQLMLHGIQHEILGPPAAGNATRHANTFLGGNFQTVRIQGPCNLVRLVGPSSIYQTQPGDFWLEANLFSQAFYQASVELRQQGFSGEKQGSYAGMMARFLLRDMLGVSHDWSNLDMFVSLNLPPGASLIALIGQARMQPYYSPNDPAHAGAETANIRLPGLGTQIVIDFLLPDNRYAARLVSAPMVF